mmetsp:Transcript_28799/g.63072  ORF Transcript_28799/g.63072 Transcript_28799/m.63072 type:complete len:283 (+) Transcript_28799:3438-4286(+)
MRARLAPHGERVDVPHQPVPDGEGVVVHVDVHPAEVLERHVVHQNRVKVQLHARAVVHACKVVPALQLGQRGVAIGAPLVGGGAQSPPAAVEGERERRGVEAHLVPLDVLPPLQLRLAPLEEQVSVRALGDHDPHLDGDLREGEVDGANAGAPHLVLLHHHRRRAVHEHARALGHLVAELPVPHRHPVHGHHRLVLAGGLGDERHQVLAVAQARHRAGEVVRAGEVRLDAAGVGGAPGVAAMRVHGLHAEGVDGAEGAGGGHLGEERLCCVGSRGVDGRLPR